MLAAGLLILTITGWRPQASTAQAAEPRPGAEAPTARLAWHPCYDGFECATALVPLDHNRPRGPVIQLDLIRLPAADPDARIGSLFINPGGPGGSGVDTVRASGPLLPRPILEHYDVVGFDPRGIIGSTPLRCFGTLRQAEAVLTPFLFPMTAPEVALTVDADRAFADACDQRARAVMDHMTTAEVARDLDLLREAVGDEHLHFVGLSYGSYLGMTYANLFPDRVGNVVLDGVLDPVAWATGRDGEGDEVPFTTRLRSHEGAQDTFEEFFRLCDEAGADCAFSPDAEERFAALADELREEPIPIALPDGQVVPFTYADLVTLALIAMDEPLLWPGLAEMFAAAEAGEPPIALGGQLTSLQEELEALRRRGVPYRNLVEGLPGVGCTDADNPTTHEAWVTAGEEADVDSYFGRPWTWLSSPCAVWPGEGSNRYTGPWDAETANPVLLVGNRFDASTPYHGAQIVDELLPNSRLLTYDGWGHVALLRDPCATELVTGYLVTGVLPPEGTVCPAAPSPFQAPPEPPPSEEARQTRGEVAPPGHELLLGSGG